LLPVGRGSHRVDNHHHHNRNRCSRALCCNSRPITRPRDDDINSKANKFSRKVSKLIKLVTGVAILKFDLFPLDPAEFA
jgi:hypothetical protein